ALLESREHGMHTFAALFYPTGAPRVGDRRREVVARESETRRKFCVRALGLDQILNLARASDRVRGHSRVIQDLCDGIAGSAADVDESADRGSGMLVAESLELHAEQARALVAGETLRRELGREASGLIVREPVFLARLE